MMLVPSAVTVLLLTLASIGAQNNPPGVPPRGANVPQQQPPAPGQQFDQQQMNVQEGRGHGHGGAGGSKLKFQSEIHNAEHIIEHLQSVIKTKPKEQMSEEELEFHYFKMHDYDNNNKLDGVEIGKALTHFHDEVDEAASDHEPAPPGQEQGTKPPPPKVFTDEEIANIVDMVIKENDENGDGYVEYFEFKRQQEMQRQGDKTKQADQH